MSDPYNTADTLAIARPTREPRNEYDAHTALIEARNIAQTFFDTVDAVFEKSTGEME